VVVDVLPVDVVVVDDGAVVVVVFAAIEVVGGWVVAGGLIGAVSGEEPPQVSSCAPGVQLSA
jgi:hypothetical protein